ncbi:BRO1-like domain-containing protein [Lineolata rhizophorae]|uniref:BRO domain-containing protein 1 n=1 Tax=Lineolata rhizophorae TaxID=578093 RepID=A0A6A6NLV9_9PEZI|nr:BRO1-like domain-containing protein [Lineolata rhizophorae]
MQAPMLSSPLKQTNEIDWIAPLKAYIRQTYGDDPERYAEECATLNRLRQDMRGAGKDSAAGRDLLYRYYGQLELLDLRFPVDENHIKISFTWFDAFTHKPTSQYSLAYEKASVIFNISAVLSCHAANQNRHEETGLKTAYHSFQASAGMFTYINENFLHAPSTDLSRDTIKTLIVIMLAQGQEVFLEKQITDGKKVGLLAKLASQAAYLYNQAWEGVQENVNRAIFEKVWLLMVQIKANYMASLAQYYQALADNDANSHGLAICRLQVAEAQCRDGNRIANSFPGSVPSNSNLSVETGPVLADLTKRHLSNIQDKVAEFMKDNDFIYHQPIPSEASLTGVPKLPAAKAIPVSELYQGQDIQRIIGPDIFQRIVPMSVTESASLYDEEKAKLVRAETEKVETANGEMAASLDYLKLPDSLNILKGGADQDTVDEEFRRWCEELAGHSPFHNAFDELSSEKSEINSMLDQSLKTLDMEESVCEKMRSKYGAEWTQQPSSRLTSTLRSDIRNYRGAIEEAGTSDAQLYSTFRQYESDFDEMRSAGETDEADVLYQRAMIKAGSARSKSISSPSSASEPSLLDEDYGEGGPSVAEQVAAVEDILRKLNLIKRERAQVLKDLKEKVHNDDISNVLILNKKSITNQETQLFKAELEKFRPHQNRLLQANHKQASLMKELTRIYSDLLQDKRVRSEQSKYESLARQRTSVMSRYRKVFQAFNDLIAGLMRAQGFYSEMKETVESLQKNVETFVNNRRSEGGQLLSQIEATRASNQGAQADVERERLKELMERMSMEPSKSPASPLKKQSGRPPPLNQTPSYSQPYNPAGSPPVTPRYNPMQGVTGTHYGTQSPQPYQQQSSSNGMYPGGPPRRESYQTAQSREPYNPNNYGPVSPPPQQQFFSPPPGQGYQYPPTTTQVPPQQRQSQSYMPPGYVPPPPPPGPPPTQDYSSITGNYPSGPGGYAHVPQRRETPGSQSQHQSTANDPWAGLNAWK